MKNNSIKRTTIIYLCSNIILALLLSLNSIVFKSGKDSLPHINLSEEQKIEFEKVFQMGSFKDIACIHSLDDNQVTQQQLAYTPDRVRHILKESGILSNKAVRVGEPGFCPGGCEFRVEPPDKPRPSFIISVDNTNQSKNMRMCVLKIIEND